MSNEIKRSENSIRDTAGWQVGFDNGWYVWNGESNLSEGCSTMEVALREAADKLTKRYEFLLPEFLEAMNDIGRYGYDKYKEQSFQHRAKTGETERWMDRVQPAEIQFHAADHFMMYQNGEKHDKFKTLIHQLGASAFNCMMEAYLGILAKQ